MLENYITNFDKIISSIFYMGFKWIIILLTIMLIAALLLLILGCIIKSQKLKSKFLRVIPLLIIGIFFILLIPVLYVHFK